ncbi:MAG: anti-sigma factor antagonist [Eubacterium sp.]|nr:anti-sigma factor antagonist [Eubacterium sp.]
MKEIQGEYVEGRILITLTGRVETTNAKEVGEVIWNLIEGKESAPVIVNVERLEYISSAGLRVLLRLKQKNADLTIKGSNADIYDVFEMTGFTEIMNVEKPYRVVSVEGCEVIGKGAHGTIYRIAQDTIVKTYDDPNALEEIQNEREVARLALILGIPTAISYEIVRVGDGYGSVFELLNARSFSSILANEPEKLDWCAEEYVKILKKIHETEVPEGKLPDMRKKVLSWVAILQGHLPEDMLAKLQRLIERVPYSNHMLHGDYHTKNLMLQGDEVLLIDMDTLAVGHPIFELGFMFNSFIGFSERDESIILKFQGFGWQTARAFWHKVLSLYLETENEEKIREMEDKARIIGYTRLLRRAVTHNLLGTEEEREEFNFRKEQLRKLLDKTDTLLFSNELDVAAEKEKLAAVMEFLESRLEEIGCPMKAQFQIHMAVEEIFVNIASYAYTPGKGRALIRVDREEDPSSVVITFMDRGIPYNPLKKADPDVTLSAEQRQIGGLGIFMVKKAMDEVQYHYQGGHNILVLKKYI